MDSDAVAVSDEVENELWARGALSRAILVAGAAQTALDLTVRYARERHQFGRPIAAFQAVQQQVAAPVAAAKIRTAQAAGPIAAIAHQVHGAIGMTQEHPLRFTTTRLWAWRSEWGGEREWAQRIAAAAVRAGDEGLWPMLVGA